MSTATMRVTIAEVREEAKEIRSYRLEALGPDGELPAFTAGSHVDVHAGPNLFRQYSLCSPPAERGYYRLGIQRDINSRGGSAHIYNSFAAGQEIEISRPRNHFRLDETGHDYLLIAGGIGITPLLAMGHRLASIGKTFRLHYAVRDASRIAFRDMLEGPSFAGCVTIACDDTHGPPDIGKLVGEPGHGRRIYCCGPTGLMDAVKASASDWPAATVLFEHFAITRPPSGNEDVAFEVTIKSSGRTLHVPADKSLLDVLIDAGYDIECSCRQGLCGTCEIPISSGEALHRDAILSEEEKAANTHMMCCVSRAKRGRIVLDI